MQNNYYKAGKGDLISIFYLVQTLSFVISPDARQHLTMRRFWVRAFGASLQDLLLPPHQTTIHEIRDLLNLNWPFLYVSRMMSWQLVQRLFHLLPKGN